MIKSFIKNVYIVILGTKIIFKMVLVSMSYEIVLVVIVILIK